MEFNMDRELLDSLYIELQITRWELSPNLQTDPAQHKQLKVKTRVLNKDGC